MFVHSLIADWDNGSAHFLRGVASELGLRGHEVVAWEPKNARAMEGLLDDAGPEAVHRFQERFPDLRIQRYDPDRLDLWGALHDADLVLVHSSNEPRLVARV